MNSLDHQDDALGRLRQSISAHGAYDFCASLGRVVDQPVVRSMLIKQGDKLCVGVFYICLHNQVPLYKNCLCVSILPYNDDIYQWQKRQAASKNCLAN